MIALCDYNYMQVNEGVKVESKLNTNQVHRKIPEVTDESLI